MKDSPKPLLIAIISIIILIALLLLVIYLLNLQENNNNPPDNETSNAIYVSRIIDGDTFELSDNTTVRLLCVDAPEKGKTGADESSDFLSEMILDKEVRLEKDITDADDYGRLLRYVYVNMSGVELFVNQQLAQEGYAKVFRYQENLDDCVGFLDDQELKN